MCHKHKYTSVQEQNPSEEPRAAINIYSLIKREVIQKIIFLLYLLTNANAHMFKNNCNKITVKHHQHQ